MNRFAGKQSEIVVLTPDEFKRPERDAIYRQKLRLQLEGYDPLEVTDLVAFHKAHPEVPLAVAV
ncbi:MAG: hypothetical protein NTY53_24610 [Kiritimatiellaeota bacterium]|nr:hypothetical protein [Kiritimatiellota bacterium]